MKNSVLITEFNTGGGLSSEDLDTSLFPESFSMLRFLIGEWEKLGFEVLSTLDYRFSWLEELLKAEFTVINSSSGYYSCLSRLAREVDHVICVAPETDGMLERCVRIFNEVKSEAFHGPAVEAMQSLSNKNLFAKYCARHGIPAPTTVFSRLKTIESVKNARVSLKASKVVVKPALGAGSENIAIYTGEEETITSTTNPLSGWVIQPLIEGTHHSATFLAVRGRVYLLSLNNQVVERSSELLYKGGSIPAIDNNNKTIQFPESIKTFVRTICRSFGIRGYFGVDFIVSGSRTFVIEVNLRPTTPVTVFDKLLPYTPAELLVKTRNDPIERVEESEFRIIRKDHLLKKAAAFSKVTFSTEQPLDDDQIISLYKKVEGFDAPPFPARGKREKHGQERYQYTGMMSMTGSTPDEAWKSLNGILENLSSFLD
ncbi:MAG: ATP-grasp domain-containing protein [Candidatus Odinarchaeota archaeon]